MATLQAAPRRTGGLSGPALARSTHHLDPGFENYRPYRPVQPRPLSRHFAFFAVKQKEPQKALNTRKNSGTFYDCSFIRQKLVELFWDLSCEMAALKVIIVAMELTTEFAGKANAGINEGELEIAG